MRRLVLAASAVAAAAAAAVAGSWWERTRPLPAPWRGWPDRVDLFPQRPRR